MTPEAVCSLIERELVEDAIAADALREGQRSLARLLVEVYWPGAASPEGP